MQKMGVNMKRKTIFRNLFLFINLEFFILLIAVSSILLLPIAVDYRAKSLSTENLLAASVGGQTLNREILEIDISQVLSKDVFINENNFSPDLRHFAYQHSGNIFLDGSKVREDVAYPALIFFSPDSKRIGYIAPRGKKQAVVVDGKEGRYYDEIDLTGPIFSPDGKRFGYVAREGEDKYRDKWLAVVDGKEGKRYDSIIVSKGSFQKIVFSPDSRKFGYFGIIGSKMFLVLDGKEIKQYDDIREAGRLSFSPNGERMCYVSRRPDKTRTGYSKYFVTLGGRDGKEYDGIFIPPIFSPDSRRLAYGAAIDDGTGGKGFVVVNGEEGEKYTQGTIPLPFFSPDSMTVAYIATKLDKGGSCCKCFVVVNGKEGSKYDFIYLPLVFSPDGKRLAYRAKNGNKWFLVVDGKEGRQFDAISFSHGYRNLSDFYFSLPPPVFSPDSKQITYIANDSGKYYVFVQGEKEKQYLSDENYQPIFSPDSKHVIYVVKEDAKMAVSVNGIKGGKYDWISFFGYGVSQIDDIQDYYKDDYWRKTWVIFNSSDKFRYLAGNTQKDKDRKIYHYRLVEERIKY